MAETEAPIPPTLTAAPEEAPGAPQTRRPRTRRSLDHGDKLHRAGIWATEEALKQRDWRLLDPDMFKDLEKERRPDVVAEGPEERTDLRGRKVKRRILVVFEIETRPRVAEMVRREEWYLNQWPPRADRVIILPLWKLRKPDSLSALRAFVAEYLPC